MSQKIGHLWIEVTQGCNLTCTHCYASSSPAGYAKDVVDDETLIKALHDARPYLNQLTLLGGEPLTVPVTRLLLSEAEKLQFERVAVHSNLYSLKNEDVQVIASTKTIVAFSFLGHDDHSHDMATRKNGSFDRAITNIKSLKDSGVSIEATFIDRNSVNTSYRKTLQLCKSLGIDALHYEFERKLGRATSNSNAMNFSELCGRCAKNTLAITSTGLVHPCSLSRFITVGDIRLESVEKILHSKQLAAARKKIANAIVISTDCIPTGNPPSDPPKTCAPIGKVCSPSITPDKDVFQKPPNSCWPKTIGIKINWKKPKIGQIKPPN